MSGSPRAKKDTENRRRINKNGRQLLCASHKKISPAVSARLPCNRGATATVIVSLRVLPEDNSVSIVRKLSLFVKAHIKTQSKGNRRNFSSYFEKSVSVAFIALFKALGLCLRQPLLNLCCRDKREPERVDYAKRATLVPRRQPSPRSVVFRRRPENKVFRLVARQNPFTEGVLAAPPTLLKKRQPTQLFFLL